MPAVELFPKPEKTGKDKTHRIEMEHAEHVVVIAGSAMEDGEQSHIERLVCVFPEVNTVSVHNGACAQVVDARITKWEVLKSWRRGAKGIEVFEHRRLRPYPYPDDINQERNADVNGNGR